MSVHPPYRCSLTRGNVLCTPPWPHDQPRELEDSPQHRMICSLCVQVRPSQPSRQMQEKESPLPTHVPPLAQGLGRQLLFLAGGGKGRERERERIISHTAALPAREPSAHDQRRPVTHT